MLGQLGGVAVVQGRLDEARTLLEEAREHHVAAGDRVGLGISLIWWGRMCVALQEVDNAWVAFDAAFDEGNEE